MTTRRPACRTSAPAPRIAAAGAGTTHDPPDVVRESREAFHPRLLPVARERAGRKSTQEGPGTP
jgi:hypothetical protein